MPRFGVHSDPRHSGAGSTDFRHSGLGTVTTTTGVDPSTIDQTWETNTWDLMKVIKYNLMHYSRTKHTESLKNMKSWNIGYVFPQTILPAITIFPIIKTFLPLQYSDNTRIVEYRYTIDIYSKSRIDLQTAVDFCTNAVDDVKFILKSRPHLIYKDGVEHCFNVQIIEQVLYNTEQIGNGFAANASMLIACYSVHTVNPDRESHSTIIDGDYQLFSEKFMSLLKYEGTHNDWNVGTWLNNTPKKVIKYPVISTTAGKEEVDETLTNRYANLIRPISANVISRGYPKATFIKSNLDLADKVVDGLEKHYNLDGYAQQFELDSIIYTTTPKDNMMFSSVIDVTYISRKKFESNYGM